MTLSALESGQRERLGSLNRIEIFLVAVFLFFLFTMTISKALKKRQKKAERKAAAKRVDVPGNSQKVDSTGQDPLAAASEEEEDLDGEMALDPGFSFEFDSNGLEAQIQKSSWKFAKDSCVKKRPGLSSTTLAEKIDQSRQQLLAEGGAPEEDGSEIESLAGSEEMDSENDLKDDTGDIDSEEEKDEEIDAPDGETESLAGNELYETVQELSDDEAEKDNDIRDTLRDKVGGSKMSLTTESRKRPSFSHPLLLETQRLRLLLKCGYRDLFSRESRLWALSSRLLFRPARFPSL